MHDTSPCCLVLLITVLVGVSLGADLTYKSVCVGNAVQVFTNVEFTNSSAISLYMNSNKQKVIAMWYFVNTSILPEYKEKVFLDAHGTIWINNIQQSDEHIYELWYLSAVQSKVKINVMVPPTKHCKPTISKMDSSLMANLDLDECGSPAPSVQWVKYPSISTSGGSMIKLDSGKEAGIYYACTESPALTCVKDLKLSAYCSFLEIEGDNCPQPRSEAEVSSASNMTIVIALSFVLLVFILVVVVVVLVILRKGTCGQTATSGNYDIIAELRRQAENIPLNPNMNDRHEDARVRVNLD